MKPVTTPEENKRPSQCEPRDVPCTRLQFNLEEPRSSSGEPDVGRMDIENSPPVLVNNVAEFSRSIASPLDVGRNDLILVPEVAPPPSQQRGTDNPNTADSNGNENLSVAAAASSNTVPSERNLSAASSNTRNEPNFVPETGRNGAFRRRRWDDPPTSPLNPDSVLLEAQPPLNANGIPPQEEHMDFEDEQQHQIPIGQENPVPLNNQNINEYIVYANYTLLFGSIQQFVISIYLVDLDFYARIDITGFQNVDVWHTQQLMAFSTDFFLMNAAHPTMNNGAGLIMFPIPIYFDSFFHVISDNYLYFGGQFM
uniref:Uncharacterized protein n=1 Tax=Panagrolaimus superbus TaxID=310955 RepID=A0A914XS83_9BILA